LALRALRDRVTAHADRELQVRQNYGEWQENLLTRTDHIRQQVAELEARLTPWMRRGESLRLAVISRGDENS